MAQRITLLNPPNTTKIVSNDPSPATTPLPATSATVSNTIDQVRELLYGEAMRHQVRRVTDVETSVQDLDQRVLRRFDEIQASIDALARALRQEQSDAIRAIGISIMEVGRQVATMSEIHDRGADRKPS